MFYDSRVWIEIVSRRTENIESCVEISWIINFLPSQNSLSVPQWPKLSNSSTISSPPFRHSDRFCPHPHTVTLHWKSSWLYERRKKANKPEKKFSLRVIFPTKRYSSEREIVSSVRSSHSTENAWIIWLKWNNSHTERENINAINN